MAELNEKLGANMMQLEEWSQMVFEKRTVRCPLVERIESWFIPRKSYFEMTNIDYSVKYSDSIFI